MRNYSLSWVFGVGGQASGGNKKCPVWQDVERYLNKIKRKRGALTLSVLGAPETGPQSLQVLSDEGRFVLSLGEDSGEDYVVRSYSNLGLRGRKYDVLGNVWSGELICLAFSDVEDAFEEFFQTGDVRSELLN